MADVEKYLLLLGFQLTQTAFLGAIDGSAWRALAAVSYTHLRAHETVLDLVCRLLLEKKKKTKYELSM